MIISSCTSAILSGCVSGCMFTSLVVFNFGDILRVDLGVISAPLRGLFLHSVFDEEPNRQGLEGKLVVLVG